MAGKINALRQVGEWSDMVKDANSGFHNRLNEIYGDKTGEKAEATKMCLRTLETFAQQYGPDRSVIIARSTGRVNLLGTHIDHRGGSVNPISIKQMWAVVEPRDDDYVLVKNVESARFPDEQFRISTCLPKGEKIQEDSIHRRSVYFTVATGAIIFVMSMLFWVLFKREYFSFEILLNAALVLAYSVGLVMGCYLHHFTGRKEG